MSGAPTPACDEVTLNRIEATMRTSDEQAMPLLCAALIEHPTDARLTLLRGSLHASQGRYADASTDLTKTLVLAPELHMARFMLGYLELCQGQAMQALAIWQPLTVLGDALGDIAQGMSALVTGQSTQAVALLQRALERNTAHPALSPFLRALLEPSKLLDGGADPSLLSDTGATEHGHHLLLSGYLAGKPH